MNRPLVFACVWAAFFALLVALLPNPSNSPRTKPSLFHKMVCQDGVEYGLVLTISGDQVVPHFKRDGSLHTCGEVR